MVSTYPPKRATAFTAVFPILDADGDLVTGAAGLDSEVSKDLGTFADCTNEATELATASGMYYLTLTATEMTADIVGIIVKTSTSGAKTTPLVFYTAANLMDDIKTDTAAIVAKLPTNYLMGSSVLTAKDDEIDDIKTMTDKIGTVTNTGGTATIGAILGDFANSALVTRLNTVDDFLDSEIAAILADTNELQTDWVNGGRLDLLVDAIKAITDTLTLAAIADAVHDEVTEGTTTLRQSIKLISSALFAKTSGGGTNTLVARDIGDTKDRITLTVDADGNRTASTLVGA